MGWMPAARRIESSRSVVARASSTDASRLRFGSVRFGSVRFVRSRHVVSVEFATKSAQSNNQSSRRSVRARRVACVVCDSPCVTHRVGVVVVVVVCDSPLRTRAYGMVGVGRSSSFNTMEKVSPHWTTERLPTRRARALMLM